MSCIQIASLLINQIYTVCETDTVWWWNMLWCRTFWTYEDRDKTKVSTWMPGSKVSQQTAAYLWDNHCPLWLNNVPNIMRTDIYSTKMQTWKINGEETNEAAENSVLQAIRAGLRFLIQNRFQGEVNEQTLQSTRVESARNEAETRGCGQKRSVQWLLNGLTHFVSRLFVNFPSPKMKSHFNSHYQLRTDQWVSIWLHLTLRGQLFEGH